MKLGPLLVGLGVVLAGVLSNLRSKSPAASPPPPPSPPKGGNGGGVSSESRIAKLEPQIQLLARRLLEDARAAGIELVVTQGLRTMEEQAALYAQGRTAPGNIVTKAKPGTSWHNFGLAFDVAIVVNGQPTWPNDEALWSRVGDLGKRLGLEWGGDFASFKDLPHFQFHPGLTLEQARAGRRLS